VPTLAYYWDIGSPTYVADLTYIVAYVASFQIIIIFFEFNQIKKKNQCRSVDYSTNQNILTNHLNQPI